MSRETVLQGGRRSWELTWKRLVKWTQLQVENLKGGARTARIGIARIVLWDQELSRQLDVTMSKDEVAVLER